MRCAQTCGFFKFGQIAKCFAPRSCVLKCAKHIRLHLGLMTAFTKANPNAMAAASVPWPGWAPEFIQELCTWMSLCTKHYIINLAMQHTRYSTMLQKTRNTCVHSLTLPDEHRKERMILVLKVTGRCPAMRRGCAYK